LSVTRKIKPVGEPISPLPNGRQARQVLSGHFRLA
jgi:hypothetical protein